MYWKMSTDLSRPLVTNMGMHDPLEGLICCLGIINRFPDRISEFDFMLTVFDKMCEGINWETSDSLGIGALLLNSLRLKFQKEHVPENISPESLMQQSLQSLDNFQQNLFNENANRRLAFRECGLALGIQMIKGIYEKYHYPDIPHARLQNYFLLAEDFEDFWLNPKNHECHTWKDHLDINEVSLAASLLGNLQPEVFLTIPEQA